MWALLFFAILSLFITLKLPYVGEEAVYTLTSLEMAQAQEWFVPTFYGINYGRPPLFNWLIIPIAEWLGWSNVLMASRLVTIGATLATCGVLMKLVQKLFHHKTLSFFTALVYLSGDLLFRRGWLAYADPLFSFFVFTAIAYLWMALEEQKQHLLYIAIGCVTAAYLTKAMTCYVFYTVALFVLYYRHPNRSFLQKKSVWVLHIMALLFPVVWNVVFSQGAHSGGMIHDLLAKWSFTNAIAYLGKVFLYPIDTVLRFAPISILLLYYWFLKPGARPEIQNSLKSSYISIAISIVLLNYLPYWAAPESHIRYLLPLYPLVAMIITYIVWQLGEKCFKEALFLLACGLVLKFGISLFWLPLYEKKRGNYFLVAKSIYQETGNQNVYAENDEAMGSSVAIHLNLLRLLEQPLLKRAPAQWESGFVLAYDPHFPNTELKKIYQAGNHRLYLLCRGDACRNESMKLKTEREL